MFTNKTFKFSDLDLLTKIFIGTKSNILVFDPYGKVDYNVDPSYKEGGKTVLINFGHDIEQYKDMQLADFDFVLDFGSITSNDFEHTESLKLFKSKSNELKWIARRNDYRSNFLSFLTTESIRANLIKQSIKTLGILRMDRLIAHTFKIHSNEKLHFKKQLKDIVYDNYSIFCGAPGKLRKPVILLWNKNKKIGYSKLAVSKATLSLINGEKQVLKRLENLSFRYINCPKIINPSATLSLTTAPLEKSKSDVPKSIQLNRALFNLFQTDLRHQKISSTSTIREIKNEIFWLNHNVREDLRPLVKRLVKISESIDENNYIHTCFSHGDFTPWNMNNSSEKLNLLDWEIAKSGRPVLYDLFHFIISKEVFIHRNTNANLLFSKINEAITAEKLNYLIEKYNINVQLHLKLYLLHKISQQLVLMSSDSQMPIEHQLLQKTWGSLLDELIIGINFKNSRTSFLAAFQTFISHKDYAAVKFLHGQLCHLPENSDLDLISSKSTARSIIEFCKTNRLVQEVRVITKSHMKIVKIFFKNDEFLSIDLIHKISRKGLVFLSTKDFLLNSQLKGGVKTPKPYFDMYYIQGFYTLNKSEIPKCYQNFLLQKFRSPAERIGAIQMLNLKYKIKLITFEESFNYSNKKRRSILNSLALLFENSPFIYLYNKLGYWKDTLASIFVNPGKIITFSGVDGAGKTTVINSITKELKLKYRKDIVLLRHRPRILPIISTIKYGSSQKAEQVASERLPRQGKNKNKVGSLMRFFYYFTDYIVGQVVVFFKYRIRGKVIVYDRYYFDFINDARRSNILLNRKFIKSLYKFIHKPAFNFYLYNEANIILKRKKELAESDIIQMNHDYRELFNQYGSKKSKSEYIQIKNDKLEDTVFQIMSELKKIA